MKNESWMQTLKDYVMLTVGTLLIAIGVYFFKFPNHFSTGGVSGISIILAHYAPNLSAGAFVFIINMALLALGFAVFGRSFGVRTAYTSLVLSCATWGLEYIVPMDAPMTSQPLLELILAFGMETGLFSMLGLVLKSVIVDMVLENIKVHKCFQIITEKPSEIVHFIVTVLGRGATELHGEGAYTHEDKTVILTVVNRYQAIKLRKYTREVDPHSFVLITNSTEIIGKGFRGLM